MKGLIRLRLCIPLLFMAFPAHAGNSTTNGTAGSWHGPLGSADPNYFVAADSFDDPALDEGFHLEFYLSLGYPFHLPASRWNLPRADRIIPIYNGLYDFYFGNSRYKSAPIVSRRQNPGLVMEWDTFTNQTFRFGYFHESNGQTLDEAGGAAAFALLKAKVDKEYALSRVSRGWDYIMGRYRFGKDNPERPFRFLGHVELRHYFGFQAFGTIDSEELVFWEPVAEQPGIREFDGVRLMAEQHFPVLKHDASLRLELKTGIGGDQAFENWSSKASCTWGVLHLFYFNGYGREPSTYHLRSSYVGLGVEFR